MKWTLKERRCVGSREEKAWPNAENEQQKRKHLIVYYHLSCIYRVFLLNIVSKISSIRISFEPYYVFLLFCLLNANEKKDFIFFFIIKGFRTIVFIFIVISTTFRPICVPAFFRCLSNSETFTELRTTSFIESMGVACSDSVSHNRVQAFIFLYCYSPVVRIEPATFWWLSP